MMTAGIIGVNWGIVHLHNLRSAGVHVGGLCATDGEKVAEVAKEHAVAFATTNPDDLAAFDVIVIASPPEAHAELLARFPDAFVICEKPLTGARLAGPRPRHDRAFVNYAFGFLDVARAASERLADLGPVEHARVASRVALESDFDVERWFLEIASHPLAWLLHPGEAEPVRRAADDHCFALEARRTDGAVIEVGLQLGGEPGIEHAIRIDAQRGRVELAGAYRPGAAWRFSAVRVNGEAASPDEAGPGDPWLRANARSVEAMLAVARGELARDAGVERGLFDVERASRVERVVFGELAT
jgi:predicted dehydrogenase